MTHLVIRLPEKCVGREVGQATLEGALRLTLWNQEQLSVEVVCEHPMYTVSSSFYLGLFEPLKRHFVTKEDFLNNVVFKNLPEHLESVFKMYLDRLYSN
jgi:hypothetical protein